MRFSKWHAHGNVYLLSDGAELTPELVRAHVGNADGIVEVVRVDRASAVIRIWNPDGSLAEMSGNGTRIAARWLAQRSGAACQSAKRLSVRSVSSLISSPRASPIARQGAAVTPACIAARRTRLGRF